MSVAQAPSCDSSGTPRSNLSRRRSRSRFRIRRRSRRATSATLVPVKVAIWNGKAWASTSPPSEESEACRMSHGSHPRAHLARPGAVAEYGRVPILSATLSSGGRTDRRCTGKLVSWSEVRRSGALCASSVERLQQGLGLKSGHMIGRKRARRRPTRTTRSRSRASRAGADQEVDARQRVRGHVLVEARFVDLFRQDQPGAGAHGE